MEEAINDKAKKTTIAKIEMVKQPSFKFFDLIMAFFVAVLIVSNVASTKIVSIGPLVFDGGTLLFPLAYIFGDVLTEVYGYKRSRKVIWTGFFCVAIASLYFALVGWLPAAIGWSNAEAYNAVLGFVPRIFLASLIAYWAGEFSNSFVLAKMKVWTKKKHLWARTIGSTIIGEGIDSETCMVEVARYFMFFTQQESCGKCTPCREGTKRLYEILTNMTRGVAKEEELEKLRALAEFVRDNSLCGLGQNATNPLLSTLKYFRNEYLMHLRDKQCPANQCSALLHYLITEKCVGCGNCKRHCPEDCISGNPREKHVIDQAKCIKCGACFDVCAFNAIEKK